MKKFYWLQSDFMVENKLNYKFNKFTLKQMNTENNTSMVDTTLPSLPPSNEMKDDQSNIFKLQDKKDSSDNDKISDSGSESDYDDKLDVNNSMTCILCNKELS